MDGFQIDEQALREVVRMLDQGAEAVRDCTRTLHDAETAGLGTADLDAVAGDLLARWTERMTRSGTHVDGATTGVRGCLARYTETERRIVDLLAEPGQHDG